MSGWAGWVTGRRNRTPPCPQAAVAARGGLWAGVRGGERERRGQRQWVAVVAMLACRRFHTFVAQLLRQNCRQGPSSCDPPAHFLPTSFIYNPVREASSLWKGHRTTRRACRCSPLAV